MVDIQIEDFLILDIRRMSYLEMWVCASSLEEAQAKIDERLGDGYMAVPASQVFPS